MFRKCQFQFPKINTDFEILSYFLGVDKADKNGTFFNVLSRKIVRGLCVPGNYNFIVGDCADIVCGQNNI